MSRTGMLKVAWLGGLGLGAGAIIIAISYFEPPLAWIFLMVGLLLIPGRVGGFFLRDLFASRRLISAGKHEEAIAASERMLHKLDRQPWRQFFMYCFFGIYTWSARAMTLNNLGAAEMELGRLEDAEVHLSEAVRLDDAYPIPYYNLGVVAAVQGNPERSADMYSIAQKLGFGPTDFDNAISRVSAAYARLQSASH